MNKTAEISNWTFSNAITIKISIVLQLLQSIRFLNDDHTLCFTTESGRLILEAYLTYKEKSLCSHIYLLGIYQLQMHFLLYLWTYTIVDHKNLKWLIINKLVAISNNIIVKRSEKLCKSSKAHPLGQRYL